MKKTAVILSVWALFLVVGMCGPVHGATDEGELRPTREIINVLKSHYVDRDKLDPKLLNDATVDGILKALGRGAQILTSEQAESNALPVAESRPVTGEPLARAEVIDPDIGYIRLADITDNTVAALDSELKKFSAARVTGYVLDLRFADGTNYDVAAEVASRFTAPNRDLFKLKESAGSVKGFRSVEAPQAVAPELSEAPLMVLANARTRGSAEALAGALHALDRGILVGARTSGSAASWDDIKLDDGRVLRMATAKIELPKGDPIFPGGLTPDIPVKIDPKVEQEAVLNASTNITLTASLQPREESRGLSEAVLVKAFRGEPIATGTSVRTNTLSGTLTNVTEKREAPGAVSSPASTTEKPAGKEEPGQQVRDVVLQRAVDILKGIRVLLSSR